MYKCLLILCFVAYAQYKKYRIAKNILSDKVKHKIWKLNKTGKAKNWTKKWNIYYDKCELE